MASKYLNEIQEQVIQTAQAVLFDYDNQTDIKKDKDTDLPVMEEERQDSAFSKEQAFASDKEYKDEKVIYLDEEVQIPDVKAVGEADYRADDLLDQMLGRR